MSEQYRESTPEQAEEFRLAIRAALTRGQVVDDAAGSYARRPLLGVKIPIGVASYLPTGLATPLRGDVTLTHPVKDVPEPSSLKLSWEYNPALDHMVTENVQDVLQNWQARAAQRGWAFTMYRTALHPDPYLQTMERASGLVNALPAPSFPQFGSRSEEHTSELQSQSNLVC